MAGMADGPHEAAAAGTTDTTAAMKIDKQILQVQKKTGGPWTEVAIVGAQADALGAAMLKGKMAITYRVLEVVLSGAR